MPEIFVGFEWVPEKGLTSNPVYLKTEDLDLSVSIWGRSGSGKSYLFFYLIENLVLNCGVPVVVLDRTGQALGLSKPNTEISEEWKKYIFPSPVPFQYFNPLAPEESTFKFGLQYDELLKDNPHFTVKTLSNHFSKYFSLTKRETRKLEALLTKKLIIEGNHFSIENLGEWLTTEKVFSKSTNEIEYQVKLFKESRISTIFSYSAPNWDKLLSKAKVYIVDVSQLPVPQQRLISNYLSDSILHWAKKKGEPSITELKKLKKEGKPLRAVFAIDEVHDVAPSKTFPPSKISLERLIREGRKYKVSTLLATQTFIGTSSVVRSTGVKFFFRMNPEETEYIVKETGLPKQWKKIIPKLPIKKKSVALLSSPSTEGLKFTKIPERMSTHGKVALPKVKKKFERRNRERMEISFRLPVGKITAVVYGGKGEWKLRKGEKFQIKKIFYPVYVADFSFKKKKHFLEKEVEIGVRKIPICGLTGKVLTELNFEKIEASSINEEKEEGDIKEIKPKIKTNKVSVIIMEYFKKDLPVKKTFKFFTTRFSEFFSLEDLEEPLGIVNIKLLLYPAYILKYAKKEELRENIRLKVVDGAAEKLRNLKQIKDILVNKTPYILLEE